jgi:predicted DNA-binding transcriptional regulator AlpA
MAESYAPEILGDDLLIGVPAIAAYLKEPKSKIYHWVSTNKIPTFRLNGKIIGGRKSEIRQRLSARTRD